MIKCNASQTILPHEKLKFTDGINWNWNGLRPKRSVTAVKCYTDQWDTLAAGCQSDSQTKPVQQMSPSSPACTTTHQQCMMNSMHE